MKIRIELDESITENEIVIRCSQFDEIVQKIQQYVTDISREAPVIVYYKENQEFYFPLTKVLFFETDEETVYAHTAEDAFKVKFRLYELENVLPKDFVRVSKSAIINVQKVYSIDRNLTSASLIRFYHSHKQVFVSRLYYKDLKLRLEERRNHEK